MTPLDSPERSIALRRSVLASFGADAGVLDELLAYNRNVFEPDPSFTTESLPLADERFVEAWRGYERRAARIGVFEALREALVQLEFPIERGISDSTEYRAAVFRGEPTATNSRATGLDLSQPETISLELFPSPAGTIPVICIPNRSDFESVLCALTNRNEPMDVPASLGAMMIAGYNNWARIHQYRDNFLEDHSPYDWPDAFKEMRNDKTLYQDRLILASQGPYSNVDSADLGLSDSQWRALSLKIRIHHECAHYFTRRLFASMRNNLHDEIMADYLGLIGATGTYSASWFLRFLGLEDESHYRCGGRLENYRGEPPLGDEAFVVLQRLVRAAALNLQQFSKSLQHPQSPATTSRMLYLLSQLTLEQLAAPAASNILARCFAEL